MSIILQNLIGRLRVWKHRLLKRGVVYSSFSGSWEDALAVCEGYGDANLLSHIHQQNLRVITGEAKGERDGMLFEHQPVAWPVAAGMLWLSQTRNAPMKVLDFGGSFGSSYRQIQPFFGDFPLDWVVVEQEGLVKLAREDFETESLKFGASLASAHDETRPETVLLSASLQYVEKPYELLDSIFESKSIEAVIFDRVCVQDGDRDLLALQRNGKPLWQSSYPVWMMSHSQLRAKIQEEFKLCFEFEASDGPQVTTCGISLRWVGMICVRV